MTPFTIATNNIKYLAVTLTKQKICMTFSLMLATSLLNITLTMFRYGPWVPVLSKTFSMKQCWILSNAFSACNEMTMWVFLFVCLCSGLHWLICIGVWRKKSKKTTENGKIFHAPELARLILLKWPSCWKQSTRSLFANVSHIFFSCLGS